MHLSGMEAKVRQGHLPFNTPDLPPLRATHNALRNLLSAERLDDKCGSLVAT